MIRVATTRHKLLVAVLLMVLLLGCEKPKTTGQFCKASYPNVTECDLCCERECTKLYPNPSQADQRMSCISNCKATCNAP